jgi:peptidoglycan/xylan/chitin deacetylase (PgdA/CDA1 family)
MDGLQLIARCIDRLGGRRVHRLARWSGVLVFNYHRIGEPGGSHGDHALFSATQDDFAEQMAFLARHFDVIGPQDLAGLADAPTGRHVLVSFDDGYRDNHELAFPVLRALGLSATFFVTTGFLDRRLGAWWDEVAWMVRHATAPSLPAGEWLRAGLSTERPWREATIHALLKAYKALDGSRCADFLDWIARSAGSGRCPAGDAGGDWMTWDMVRALRAGGMTIGGHTVNHAVLSRLTPEQQAAEITGAGARIQAELGEPMRWFAYPVGGRDAFDAHTRHALQAAGVELAFSYYGGYRRAGAGDWDRFDVRRVAIERLHDRARFRATACLPGLYGDDHEPLMTRLRTTAVERMWPIGAQRISARPGKARK